MIGIAVPFAIGWVLAAPVQISVGKAPSDLGAETVEFKGDSGAIVKGWWCPTVNSRGVVLLLPGIRANRLSMVDRARFLRRAGYSVLLIDFQATGETKGDHITFGWKESRDALAAVDFIHHVQPSARIAIIGSSLGGVAALLATPPLKVSALILESVYPTIEIATRNRMENYLGPIGRVFAPLFLMQLHRRIGVSPSQLHPIDHIAVVDCPVLIMSGQKESDIAAISSTATKNALEIEGKADAEAASIYAAAFNPPDAQELYSFLRSLDVMRAGFEKDTTAVISTNSELGRLLKTMAPTSAAPKPTGP